MNELTVTTVTTVTTANLADFVVVVPEAAHTESMHQKYAALEMVTKSIASIDSPFKGLILTGTHGISKSWTVNKVLDNCDMRCHTVKGHITPMALYHELEMNNQKDQLVLFDDADGVFTDNRALNLLKGAADPTGGYRVCWENVNNPDQHFIFQGKIIIITNAAMHTSPHYKALTDRYFYYGLDLTPDEIKAKTFEIAQLYIEQGMELRWIIDTYNWFCGQQNNLTYRRYYQAVQLAMQFKESWRIMAPMMLK